MRTSPNSAAYTAIRCLVAGIALLPVTVLAGEPDGRSGYSRLSSDGRFVVFQSDATNFVNDEGILDAIYVYERDTGQTTRPVNASTAFGVSTSAGAQFISFASNDDNLVPDDTNRNTDV